MYFDTRWNTFHETASIWRSQIWQQNKHNIILSLSNSFLLINILIKNLCDVRKRQLLLLQLYCKTPQGYIFRGFFNFSFHFLVHFIPFFHLISYLRFLLPSIRSIAFAVIVKCCYLCTLWWLWIWENFFMSIIFKTYHAWNINWQNKAVSGMILEDSKQS